MRTVLGKGGKYRFKGVDGSLGYRTGKVYRLWLTFPQISPGDPDNTQVTIQRSGWQLLFYGGGLCPYDNQKLFFENWEIVE